MSSQNSETNTDSQSQTASPSSFSNSQSTSSFSNSQSTSSVSASHSGESQSSLSSTYDTQDENLSQELDSDWSESDDEENDPTWNPNEN